MLPRKIRLPHYLADIQPWIDLADAFDEVFGDKIDNPIRMLADLRNVDNYHPDRLLEHVGIDILNPSDRTNAAGDVWHERVLRIQQANTIGFNYFDSNIFTDDVYDAFVKQAAQFFPEKGTGTFTSFLGFCLNAVLDMASLWSEDHKLFYTDSEVASLVGFNEVYEGGTYYPTPHIELTIDAESSSTVSIDKLVELFYFLAPINLVIERIIVIAYATMSLNTAMHGQMTVRQVDKLPEGSLNVALFGQMTVYNHQSI
jgi:hypothetical protein